jgi:hypothetical protein
MNKTILAIASAAAFVGSSYVSAFAASDERAAQQPQYFAANDEAFTDARIAGLKASLELTPDQEKNWSALEATLRDLARQRIVHAAEWDAQRKGDGDQRRDALQRLQRISDGLSTRAANLKTLSEAAKPLYNSLDDAQKSRFGRLLMMASFGGHHWRHAETESPGVEIVP